MEYKEAYAKSLRLLNVRFLSEGELRKKLKDRQTPDAVIDDVLAMLKEEHFIDDERLAHDVYRYYIRKGQYGRIYIVNRLRKRQLPVPEDIEYTDEYDVAKKLICRKFGTEGADPRKIARYLQYRGFATAVIKECLNWD
ncbi:MAG: recombination regulator RecX [Megasphaera sp.]|jgi:regulatory protein|nr:recombination regulator RecX [Megasphaera sp.]MCH4187089.1 recombination regulator RecX [Megasphaera sp.]MCH4216975.1 recombination regulator RecX [Megasphaera sp.]